MKREKGRLPYSMFKGVNTDVFFLNSCFKNQPPTAFFPYPKYTKESTSMARVRRYSREDLESLFLSFRIADTTHIYNAVCNTMTSSGFTLTETNPYYNLVWTGYTKVEDIQELGKY